MLEEGKIDELVELLETDVESSPDDYSKNFDLAVLYSVIGKYNDAITLYERIIDNNPDNENTAMNLVNIGLMYQRVKQFDKAFESLEKVTKMAETKKVDQKILYLAHTNLGVVYESVGDFDRAVKEYKEAISIDSSDDMARSYLNELKESGDPDYGILRTVVTPDGKKITSLWYYRDD